MCFVPYQNVFFTCSKTCVLFDSKTCVLRVVNTGVDSNSYIRHPQMPFLRRVIVGKTICVLRNMGVIPFRSDPSSMPSGMEQVDNFTQFKLMFHFVYCFIEGLARTSDLARENLIYLFNGACEQRQSKRGPKRSTIIFEVP